MLKSALMLKEPLRLVVQKKRFRGRRMRLGLAIASMFLLTACAQTTGTGASSACSVWRGIRWDVADTDETIREVKVNNARRDAFCKGVK
jgi:hypothetical protein